MSNQPPKEITTPPEGYEWTGKMLNPGWREYYGELCYTANGVYWKVKQGALEGHNRTQRPILRKVKPPTLPVDLPREAVEYIAEYWPQHSLFGSAAAACSEALRKEAENE